MKIQITRFHIKEGKPGKSEFCPIALSIKETLGVKKVEVRYKNVGINNHMFKLPAVARRFVLAFDNKNKVRPFTFEL